MDVCINSLGLQASSTFDNIYTKSVILKGELFSAETQVGAYNNYGKLRSASKKFKIFCEQLKEVSAKPKRKATFRDMF